MFHQLSKFNCVSKTNQTSNQNFPTPFLCGITFGIPGIPHYCHRLVSVNANELCIPHMYTLSAYFLENGAKTIIAMSMTSSRSNATGKELD